MRQLLEQTLKGHADAVDLCMAVFEWANDYDHLVDGDVTGEAAEDALHNAMWLMAVVIPGNPFYRRFYAELSPLLASGISTWRVSNALPAYGTENALMLAHVLRWTLIEFFMHCALIVGGRAWATQVGPGFWMEMTKDHSFAQFMAESKGT